MKDSVFIKLEHLIEACIRHRLIVTVVIGLITVLMAVSALRVDVKTVFADLSPRNHPYVKIHEKYQKDFGGSNVVSIMLEVDQGDIFNPKVLEKVKAITKKLELVDGANSFQIISLASKKLREIRASTDSMESKPVMWPDVPQTEEGLRQLKNAVLNNSMINEVYVSKDLKSTLITVDFYEDAVDYSKIFPQVNAIADSVRGDGVRVHVVGEPILFGWVNHYLSETYRILFLTISCLISLLFIVMRTWRGTLLPLFSGIVSAIWALGSAHLLGYNLDPLVIVIAFLITARAISHSVQLVMRFDQELAAGVDTTRAAASAAMLNLFKPGRECPEFCVQGGLKFHCMLPNFTPHVS